MGRYLAFFITLLGLLSVATPAEAQYSVAAGCVPVGRGLNVQSFNSGCTNTGQLRQLDISGSTSGIVSIKGQAAAGTWNFNLPITPGSAGEVLTSQGGGAAAMTWTSAGTGTVTNIATTSPITGGPITATGTIACATCVTSAASLASGQLIAGAGGQASAVTNLTGDVTTSGGVATTLATVNSNVGTFGSATQSTQITANGKGLITAIANVTVTPAVGSITGLGTNVGTFLATPSSANLAAALTDETGSGAAVFGTSPILTTVDARGVWTAGATWTLPAHTLGGTVSGGGNQINNVIIGNTTPLAGSFTAIAGTSLTLTGQSTALITAGRLGATTPAFQVDSNIANSITGIKITAAATTGGVAVLAIGETNVSLSIAAAGNGTTAISTTSGNGSVSIGNSSAALVSLTASQTKISSSATPSLIWSFDNFTGFGSTATNQLSQYSGTVSSTETMRWTDTNITAFSTLTAASTLVSNVTRTIASAALQAGSAAWADVNVQTSTTTLSGSTNISAFSISKVQIEAPVITASAAAISVAASATVYIGGAPTASSSGGFTPVLTNVYSFRVQSGKSWFLGVADFNSSVGIGVTSSLTSAYWLGIAAGATGYSQINFAASTAPTSPVDGDLWFETGSCLKLRVSGANTSLCGGGGTTYTATLPISVSAASVISLGVVPTTLGGMGRQIVPLRGGLLYTDGFGGAVLPRPLGDGMVLVSGPVPRWAQFSQACPAATATISGCSTLSTGASLSGNNTWTGTNTFTVGTFTISSPTAVLASTTVFTGQLVGQVSRTIASGATLSWNDFANTAGTTTVSGTTNVTNPTYKSQFNGGTLSNASIVVTDAAALGITSAPAASGGMTITNTWGLYVATGVASRLDTLTIAGIVSDAAQTDNTVCVNSVGLTLKGSGTLGICLGTSGRQFKDESTFRRVTDGLEQVLLLSPLNFYYKQGFGDGGIREHYGLIADEVAPILPRLVHNDANGVPISVDLLGMTPVMIHAIQQLKAENDNLRAANDNLVERVLKLEAK